MISRKLLLWGCLLIAGNAHSIECVELKKNNSIEFEMKKSESFDNCFVLGDLPNNTPIQIVLFSEDKVRSKTVLYDMSSGGAASYISEYISDSNGATIIQSNTTNRKLGFKIIPTSKTTTNKDIHLTYIRIPEGAQIIGQVFDIAGGTSPVTPPVGGNCVVRHGQEICYEER